MYKITLDGKFFFFSVLRMKPNTEFDITFRSKKFLNTRYVDIFFFLIKSFQSREILLFLFGSFLYLHTRIV